MSSTIITLVSGGLDSCVMVAELGRSRRVLPAYVRAGLRWEPSELRALRRFLGAVPDPRREELRVLELPLSDLYDEHWSLTGAGVPGYDGSVDSNYLPGRNLLLLSKVAVLCAMTGAGEVAIAPLVDNPFPDGTPDFFREFAAVAGRALGVHLSIEIPFRDLTKAEVIRRGRGLPLELTLSCIRPLDDVHCGDCTKCAERQVAFDEAGIADPTRYARLR